MFITKYSGDRFTFAMISLSMPTAKNQRLENNIDWKTTKKEFKYGRYNVLKFWNKNFKPVDQTTSISKPTNSKFSCLNFFLLYYIVLLKQRIYS